VTLETFLHYSSLWAIVISVIGLAFAVRNYHRQVKAQIFFQISDRYHNLLNSSPLLLNVRLENEEIPEQQPEFTTTVLRYLFIVHFAYVLRQLGYLPKDLWRLLQAEHRRTLSNPRVSREWNVLKREFETFPTFIGYIDGVNSGQERSAHSDPTSDP
jgi:hypothetical protein